MSQDKPKPNDIDGRDLWFGVVAARYNGSLVDSLLERCRRTLRDAKVPADHIKVVRVPGSAEVPYAAHMLAMTGEYDCVIALGVVVAGDTPHHEVIAQSTAAALQESALRSEVPLINGIVVTLDAAQAEARCRGALDRGAEFARAALEMALHRIELGERLDQIAAEEKAQKDGADPFAQN
jgi:6,7-dimethyl-8-ribityllumazine synthase